MYYSINLTEEAENHLKKFSKNDKSIVKKINSLIKNTIENPRKGIGKPERLKYKNDEFYSRRINKYHRMVYKIDDTNKSIIIISLYGHYNN
ncbi:Txe/YoeB family addiction module toxin [uncultured Brachyspira sp.]|uniref:Txe/YoeB family addiction module toxin n=1 Tax=uncultured Brachyspira sp. TaxID=221953 RepID=UPI0025D31D3E|nr:Txe/YoeB family addiction module toxin [uncultured Brachyspira sp.]